MSESVVDVEERVTTSIARVEVPDEKLPENNIKSSLGIEIEAENRKFEGIQRMLDCFSKQYSSDFMATSFPLELSIRLVR